MLYAGMLRDVGTATPAALFQIYLWAIPRGDTNRIAQLLAIEQEIEKTRTQRLLEELHERASVGREAVEASAPVTTWRIIEVSPAGDDDRWVVSEFNFRTGATALARTRVRPTAAGWKFVLTADGPLVQEKFEEATGQWREVRYKSGTNESNRNPHSLSSLCRLVRQRKVEFWG